MRVASILLLAAAVLQQLHHRRGTVAVQVANGP